jgi:hypothetical protein
MYGTGYRLPLAAGCFRGPGELPAVEILADPPAARSALLRVLALEQAPLLQIEQNHADVGPGDPGQLGDLGGRDPVFGAVVAVEQPDHHKRNPEVPARYIGPAQRLIEVVRYSDVTVLDLHIGQTPPPQDGLRPGSYTHK